MCGIVGVVAERNAVPILMEGLRRLEYRGYDSAGLAVLDHGHLERLRTVGKVNVLQQALDAKPINGSIGIAHTRWATHGVPTTENAHPHISRGKVAIVHNGIIENHEALRAQLKGLGYTFTSETDTEVIAHRIHYYLGSSPDLLTAVRKTVTELQGAYALAVLSEADPECIVMARQGCPAVIGLGIDENFAASDVAALLPVTRRFMFLEEGDLAEVRRRSVRILDGSGKPVIRAIRESDLPADAVERGQYRHFMLKEIHEQPRAIAQKTLEERIAGGKLLDAAFGPGAAEVFKRVKAVHIAACGTSYHAGLVASYLIEEICRIPARVEIASEYRYRDPVITPDTLFVTISQSGETADTLAALRNAKQEDYLSTLTICNVAESSMVRESNLVLLTRAGPGDRRCLHQGIHDPAHRIDHAHHRLGKERSGCHARKRAGRAAGAVARLGGEDPQTRCHHPRTRRGVRRKAPCAVPGPRSPAGHCHGRRAQAQGNLLYPCGRLPGRGTQNMDRWRWSMRTCRWSRSRPAMRCWRSSNPICTKCAHAAASSMCSPTPEAGMQSEDGITVIKMPVHATNLQAPTIFAIPMQLLAYHVAVLKGTDVDQPRNLAKSLTVE